MYSLNKVLIEDLKKLGYDELATIIPTLREIDESNIRLRAIREFREFNPNDKKEQ